MVKKEELKDGESGRVRCGSEEKCECNHAGLERRGRWFGGRKSRPREWGRTVRYIRGCALDNSDMREKCVSEDSEYIDTTE